MTKRSRAIRIGVGGWSFPPWRETFFSAGLARKNELAYASRQLSAIEINSADYRTQKPDTFSKWREETPADFVFSVKAPRAIVQQRALGVAGESIAWFRDSGLDRLGEKLGPILWQFAPTKTFDPDDFAAFPRLLPREIGGRVVRHALEARHDSFVCSQFVDLARARGAAIVTAVDSPTPQMDDATADFAYLRIMGTRADEPLGYRATDFDHWARQAHAIATRATARDVFLFVIAGAKHKNSLAAQAWRARLNARDQTVTA